MARPDVNQTIRLYGEAKTLRIPHEADWRKASAYCLPAHYGAWHTEGPTTFQQSPQAARRIAYDTTGFRSLPKYKAILERLTVPASSVWHGLTASNAELRKSYQVQKYFDEVRDVLFRLRGHPMANFRTGVNEVFGSMGAYGNGPIFIGRSTRSAIRPRPGFKYVPAPLRDVFFLVDDEGNVYHVFRRFWLNARQFPIKFGQNVAMPPIVQAEANKADPSESRMFEFIHSVCVCDMKDHDPEALDVRRHPVRGNYIAVDDKVYVGEEEGYASMPYRIPRPDTVSGTPYGFSPAILALAAMGSASAMKKTVLKQGQKAVDPVLLAHDDGVMNGTVDQRPGAVNYGGVDSQGRLLIQPLPTGNFRVAEQMMADERRDVEDSFFVTLFQILTETPEMTATEVVERVAEKAALLAPTMGRIQSELLGPMIQREIEIATELGEMPEMPPEMVEAQGEYEIMYTSPQAKGQYAEEVSGYMRAFEWASAAAAQMQDPSVLDPFDVKSAIPEIAGYMGAPARWMNDPAAQDAKASARNEQMQNAELLKNAPALASAAKTAAEMEQPRGRTR